MTSRREDNAVRGFAYALLPALIAWAILAVVLMPIAILLPTWVLYAVGAALIVGPLLLAAVAAGPRS